MIKYHAKDIGNLAQVAKNALCWIEYKRAKEVTHPSIIKEIDECSWYGRTNLIGLVDSYKWDSYSYQQKFDLVEEASHDMYSRLSYRWWYFNFGDSYKREIEQIIILVGAYMKPSDDYIEVKGELMDKMIAWSSLWEELIQEPTQSL